MKGVNYITDNNNNKTAVVIDMKTLQHYNDKLEDLLDILVAESRAAEPNVPWETVKKNLKKKGKL